MSLEMVDGEIRFTETNRQTFGDGRSNHERNGQAGSARRREGIDADDVDPGVADCAFEQARRVHEVTSRSDFRHDASIRLVLGLRCDVAHEQLRAAQNGDGRFVAGSFERENCAV